MENTENHQEEKILWHKPEVQKLTVSLDTLAGSIIGAASDLASA